MHVLKKSTEIAKQKKIINLLVGGKRNNSGGKEKEREREREAMAVFCSDFCMPMWSSLFLATNLSNIFLLSKLSRYGFYSYKFFMLTKN